MNVSKQLLIKILIPLTLLVAGAGFLAFLASYISPESFTFPAFMGLAMPLILATNLFLCIFWFILRKKWGIIPGLIILLNIGYLTSVFQITFSSSRSVSEPDIRLATYNVRNFRSWDLFPSQYYITTYLNEQQINVVCFQEYLDYGTFNTDSLGKLLDLPYHAVEFIKNSSTQGSAIFSKFPILQSGHIDFYSKVNHAMWVDLQVGGQVVRVISCHLQTTDFSSKGRQLKKEGLQYGNLEQASPIIESAFRDLDKNFALRAKQADIIRQITDTTHTPVIVCGDFNDTPASYTYHRIKNKLNDSFRARGNGYSYTFKGLRRLLRIDFIFYSSQLKCVGYESPNLEWSDHNPVISEFVFAIP